MTGGFAVCLLQYQENAENSTQVVQKCLVIDPEDRINFDDTADIEYEYTNHIINDDDVEDEELNWCRGFLKYEIISALGPLFVAKRYVKENILCV